MTVWQKIVAFFKRLLGKTTIDDKALEALLNLAIAKFMEHYGDKAHTASKTFIAKVESSIKQSIRESDNKFDDLFLPFIEDFFKTITTKVVDTFLVKDDIKLTLENFKNFIIGKYSEWENK